MNSFFGYDIQITITVRYWESSSVVKLIAHELICRWLIIRPVGHNDFECEFIKHRFIQYFDPDGDNALSFALGENEAFMAWPTGKDMAGFRRVDAPAILTQLNALYFGVSTGCLSLGIIVEHTVNI